MKIKVIIAKTGETIPVEEIDLGQVTNVTLIQELINSGQIAAPQGGSQYRLIGKQNEILSDTVTLQEAGFKDGDTITLVEKAIAASYYDSENDPVDNDEGTGASSGEE